MKLYFVGSPQAELQGAIKRLTNIYGQSDLATCDYIIPVGGDGTTLCALHECLKAGYQRPVFAMRLKPSVGALGNRFDLDGLPKRLDGARKIFIAPLRTEVTIADGTVETIFGINELVLSRQRLQSVRLMVRLGSAAKPNRLIGDGVLVSTPVGSTGYNRAAGGPELMLDSRLIAVTGIEVREADMWRRCVVDEQTSIQIDVLNPLHHSVRLETVEKEVRNVVAAEMSCCRDKCLTLLFDEPGERA